MQAVERIMNDVLIALGDILDRWIGRIEDKLIDAGADENDPTFDDQVRRQLDEQLVSLTGGQAPQDFIRVIQTIFDLKQQGDVRVMSSPRVSATNNQKAVIKVGSDEFFVTGISGAQNQSVGNQTQQTDPSLELTPFFSGISLDVTPQISEDGEVLLHVQPTISEVQDQTKLIVVGDRDYRLRPVRVEEAADPEVAARLMALLWSGEAA
jgi:hypothetical protein